MLYRCLGALLSVSLLAGCASSASQLPPTAAPATRAPVAPPTAAATAAPATPTLIATASAAPQPTDAPSTAAPAATAASVTADPAITAAPSSASATPAAPAADLALIDDDGRIVLISGGERQTITTVADCEEINCQSLAWSPDGYRLGTADGVWTFGADNQRPARSPIAAGSELRWSPDGQHVAWLIGIPPGTDDQGNYIGDDAIGVLVGGPDGAGASMHHVRGGIMAPITIDWAPGGVLDDEPVAPSGPPVLAYDPNSTWLSDGRHAMISPDDPEAGPVTLSIATIKDTATITVAALKFERSDSEETVWDSTAFAMNAPPVRWLPDGAGLLVSLDEGGLADANGTWLIGMDGSAARITTAAVLDLAADGRSFLARTPENHIVSLSLPAATLLADYGAGANAAWRPARHGPPPAAPLVEQSPTLKRTSPPTTGEPVREVQEILAGAGVKLTVDGVFGAQTEAAVRDFQAKHGLTADGIVGPRTWSELRYQAMLKIEE